VATACLTGQAAARILGASAAVITDDEVVEKMEAMKIDDPLFVRGCTGADGRKMHGPCPFEVNSPAESKGPRDCHTLLCRIPADEAFRPLDRARCPIVK